MKVTARSGSTDLLVTISPTSSVHRWLDDHPRTTGAMLALMIAFAIMHGVWPQFPAWPSGLAGWLAGMLLWRRISFGQRIQVAVISGLGLVAVVWGWYRGGPIDGVKLLYQNHALLAMLAAVTFLRLVSLPEASQSEDIPRGWPAYLRTLIGIHFFGAAINLSAVAIFGDRLAKGDTIDQRTAILISRGFSSVSLWSPFFAGMAVVLTYSRGAELPVLIAIGMPLAVCGLLFTFAEAVRLDPRRLAEFSGYPVHFQSLWVPGLLAAGVLLTHGFLPQWSILTVISLVAPVLTYLILLQRLDRRRAGAAMRQHVYTRLPNMSGELLLFLAAGVLAVGLTSVFASFGDWLPFTALTGPTASLTLLVLVALAAIGIHPIISVSAVAASFAPINPDPTLLAMVFLMTWGIGVASSPLSGTHLLIQGRFGIEGWRFFRWNLSYCLFLLLLGSVILHLYVWLT